MGDPNSQDSDSKPKVSFDEFVLFDVEEGGGLSSDDSKPRSSGASSDSVRMAVTDTLGDPGDRHRYRDVLLKRVLSSGKPNRNETLTPDTATAMVRYPHVLQKFKIAWWNPELFAMTVKEFSVVEERVSKSPDAQGKVEYHRAGFPIEVINEIAALVENHERLYGLPKGDSGYHFLR